ncbi:CRE-TPH-1 protein [Caenorhabditis remanei]|uniref:CRE-TPH-1 protein n=2 Tax=Caenorhabditis remanei TaxID=31234 RepID=E3LQ80_CAERE|nr:CRE-TPH-1 protein [Caenorhabditis remanei]
MDTLFQMASAMKFQYYSKKAAGKTMSNSVSMSSDTRMEDFKRRFRRSGSLGIPFVPEEDVKQLFTPTRTIRKEPSIREGDEDEGVQILTIIVKSSRVSDDISKMIANLPDHTRVKHLETRDSQDGSTKTMDVLLEIELFHYSKQEAMDLMRLNGLDVHEVSFTIRPTDIKEQYTEPGSDDATTGSEWFPKSIYDLDICAKRVIMYGAGLDADHPGFKDTEYRQRRMMFAELALHYKHGEPIPRIEYTDSERKTWGVIYRKLRELHKKHACKQFLDNFELLERHCGYSENNIPQLEDICKFLKAKTGFRVRPVAGYLSARDFLAGLAYRVFFCTQYVRHHADPFYTPEPDTVHELMGHMALFADPDFAQFSQEIGLASLGASEEDLKKLATLYFFSIEFGLSSDDAADSPVKETGSNNERFKVYGAGLLSSAGELQHAVEGSATIIRFDPDRVVEQECLITTFQSAYFYTRNFEEAQQKLRMFTNNMKRPFIVRYNPYTESVEVLNNSRSIMLAVNSLRSDINLLAGALHYIL